MSPRDWESLLYQALAEPIGLVLRTSDWERARQALYAARRRLADPALEDLQFRAWAAPDGGQDLAICHRTLRPASPDQIKEISDAI